MSLWTLPEFITLLQNDTLSDADAGKLIGRSDGAIDVVREGVDAWHRGRNHSMLNQEQVDHLNASSRTKYVCARCTATI